MKVKQCPCCSRHTLTQEWNDIFGTIMDFCGTCEYFRESRLELLLK